MSNTNSNVFAAIHTLRLALFECWYEGRNDDEGTRYLARAIAHLQYKDANGR